MRTHHADKLIAASPGLRVLARALRSPATPDELAGEQATLAMFRQVAATRRRSHRLRRPALARSTLRGVWVGTASVFALSVSGLGAAAYLAVLPVPVQHAAHHLLGFAGIPNAHPDRDGTPGAGSAHTQGDSHGQRAGHSAPTLPGQSGGPTYGQHHSPAYHGRCDRPDRGAPRSQHASYRGYAHRHGVHSRWPGMATGFPHDDHLSQQGNPGYYWNDRQHGPQGPGAGQCRAGPASGDGGGSIS